MAAVVAGTGSVTALVSTVIPIDVYFLRYRDRSTALSE
jgi:hypothetical protein